MLNLSPEERVARRRAQLADSQRKLRANKRQGESKANGYRRQSSRSSSDTSSPPAHRLERSPLGGRDAAMARQSKGSDSPPYIARHVWGVTRFGDKATDITRPFCGQSSDIAVPVAAMSIPSSASIISSNPLQRTDSHFDLVTIDHPSEFLPCIEGMYLNGVSHGMAGHDASTELFSLSDDLTLNIQAYGNDISDVSTGFLSSVGDVATNDQSYCTSIYEGFAGEFFDHCQIDPSLEFSVHEPPFICDKHTDSQSLNEWALRSYGNKTGCVPATTDIASGTTTSGFSCLDPQWLTCLSAISHSYQDITVDPSIIFR